MTATDVLSDWDLPPDHPHVPAYTPWETQMHCYQCAEPLPEVPLPGWARAELRMVSSTGAAVPAASPSEHGT